METSSEVYEVPVSVGEVYEVPVLVEVGEYAELTRGSIIGPSSEAAHPPFNRDFF
ncbi:lasso RiPP family leader peptide-containing protein [Streptomyces luteireticuli]|uniref:lasso RiPP family leader peptide-containing protein n=1 Tax=Streptomyces luteireticuli TaxID=173858 RepID=UPI003558F9B9